MTDGNASEQVLFARHKGVGVLSLNRPERLNALSGRMVRQASERLAALAQDPTFRVLILTGAGRGFCSGADLGEAEALAARLAAGPPLAFAEMKRQLREAPRQSLREALQAEAAAQDALIRTEDAQDAITAYRARRAPAFHGR